MRRRRWERSATRVRSARSPRCSSRRRRRLQPAVAAAICLLGTNCSSHIGYLRRCSTFAETYPGYQELLRGAAAGLGAIARQGNAEALQHPVRRRHSVAGSRSRAGRARHRHGRAAQHAADAEDAAGRGPIRPARSASLAEAFDMLEEDLEEERFFVAVRRGYWAAPDGSPTRKLCEQLITKLDF